MANIDNKTKIELYAVLGGLPVIIGFIFWISVIYQKVDAHEKDINQLKVNEEKQIDLLIDIRERIIRLETKSQ